MDDGVCPDWFGVEQGLHQEGVCTYILLAVVLTVTQQGFIIAQTDVDDVGGGKGGR